MTPETRAMIVWLLETHSISVVHGMMRRNSNTAPVEHVTIRSIRRTMLRYGAEHRPRGTPNPRSADTTAMIRAMLEKLTPLQVFQTLQTSVTGETITLNEVHRVRREMLANGAPRAARPGPAPRFTAEERAERKRNQQRQAKRAKRQELARIWCEPITFQPRPSETIADAGAYGGSNLLFEATEAMFARKARRLGCSHEAARLATLYSRAQLEQRLAA